jgi:polar amino acid transport system substrate-binding protein
MLLIKKRWFLQPELQKAKAKIPLTEKEKEFLSNNHKITLGAPGEAYPYAFTNKDGVVYGYDQEIINKINKLTGANFELTLGPWDEMVKKAELREIDGLSSSAAHDERQKLFFFSDPYVSNEKMLVVRRGNPHRISGPSDLSGKRIAIVKGNLADTKLAKKFPGAEIVFFNTYEEIIKSISKDKVHAAFDYGGLTLEAAKLNLPYIELGFPLQTTLTLVISIRNDWPEALSIINKALAAIPDDEKLRLKQKWFLTSSPKKAPMLLSFTQKEKDFLSGIEEITIGYCDYWFPFSFFGSDDKAKGMLVDFTELVSKRIGKKIRQVKKEPWVDFLKSVEDKELDLLGGALKTPSRRKYMEFSKPLLRDPLSFSTRQEMMYTENFDEVKDKSFTCVEGYAFAEILQRTYPSIKIILVKNPLEGLKLVRQGKAYGYVDSSLTIYSLLREQNMLDMKINGKVTGFLDIGIGIRKGSPELISIIEKAILSISEEDRRRIINRWTSFKVETSYDFWLLAKVVFVLLILGGFAFFIQYTMMLKAHEKQLKHEVEMRTKELVEQNKKLDIALKELKTIGGLLPICSSCKKIRDDYGYWNQIEEYIIEHSEAKFTHGICPDCADKLYPGLLNKDEISDQKKNPDSVADS